ncbi:MAG: hypothetical protein IPO98_03060 [Saprospiraceae bacterium]|nr:hypothetical protein [Saprospiraceae bacterium]
MNKCFILLLYFSIHSSPTLSQVIVPETSYKNNVGKFYLYWGWNQENYSNSDISFEGADYNFTLDNVNANDRQTKFGFDAYLNPTNATIPQYNFRFGYFLTNNYNISIGIDHMKYVVKQDQTVKISVRIDGKDTEYQGNYLNEDIVLKENFLVFEHTDGLNYVNTDIRRVDELLKIGLIDISVKEGFGLGVLVPRTDATVLGREKHDKFHVSGYGFNIMFGVNIKFFNHFFIQSEYKAGFINMQNIKTGFSELDKAQQNFYFGQYNILFGYQF